MLLNAGGACRSRVTKKLSQKFKSPVDAEKHFEEQTHCDPSLARTQPPSSPVDISSLSSQPPSSPDDISSLSSLPQHTTQESVTPIFSQCLKALQLLTLQKKLDTLSQVFSVIINKRVPCDFLALVCSGMENLQEARRSNIIYLLAKAVGTKRDDGSDTLLPTKRMPMGLLEYMVSFFTGSSINKVH